VNERTRGVPKNFAMVNRLAADVKGGLAAPRIAAGLEGLIFQSCLYALIIEPDSTTGFM
jgi:hypothetical protein